MQSAAALATVPNPEFTPRPAYENVRHFQGVTTFKPQPEAMVKRERSQSDQLGLMYDRKQIGDVLKMAGREFQRIHEAAGDKLPSSGDLKDFVDGGRAIRTGATDNQRKAVKRIIEWQGVLGVDGYEILCLVLLQNCTIQWVADHDTRMMPGKRATEAMGYTFRRHLSNLARAEGFAGERGG